MEENQFIEVMRKHSDEKLLEILNVKRKDYKSDMDFLNNKGLADRINEFL